MNNKYFETALLMDEALLILLQKKEYQYITVKEICLKAGVNRSTFYLHYETINDLLEETIEMLNNKFLSSFDEKSIDEIDKKDKIDLMFINKKYLNPYLNFIYENKSIFKMILKKPELFKTQKTFNKMYVKIFEPILNKYKVDKEKQIYIFSYFFGGVLKIILTWIELDCQTNIDDISNIIIECVSRD